MSVVRFASGDICEKEARKPQRTSVAEQVESIKWPAGAEIMQLRARNKFRMFSSMDMDWLALVMDKHRLQPFLIDESVPSVLRDH